MFTCFFAYILCFSRLSDKVAQPLQSLDICAKILIMMSKKKKEATIKANAKKEGDTGSPEVQIALLTNRINDLSGHLKKNRKDRHSRRGLLQLVADRQKHLRYLKKKNEKRYDSVRKKLGLK
jgi:small subunit ribosomal protein S15